MAAEARLSVSRLNGKTRLSRLYQEGAAKVRMPFTQGDHLEAILINTAGGLTGGDRIAWEVDVGADASCAVTTQASEKVYRALSGRAELSAKISVAAGGRIAWLPQETILFDRSAFSRQLYVNLAEGAEALVVEATVFGRLAMGERVMQGDFRDRWRITRDGRLVHAENFAIGPQVEAVLQRGSVGNGAAAFATVLLVSPDASGLLEAVRGLVGEKGGASAWTVGKSGKLLARLYDRDGYSLRKRLMPLVELLNGRAGLPKTWSL
ncbi:Urease accessory protein UreD [Mesorhizobium alhagi CCNWXJ12-2]|uniref:Urease accessory protein UreD n=1 Tax=Mesorhizobium alhagi CCNWXJ12-2 TaxID=1107882 RepID=H0HKI6_9HYPH|nr:Urease accessory protein UreD [Mesorhizobium alhagi CCNWXJ12-2]